ncbi:hypothetical protein [Pseudonocardia sp. HH130630-07]|uniref:hypothetical protein n=1 Tax=Pseudonocardia sp. HH130630-07 TaxID=1690815 RepID=UPI000815165F|nr:hypothetical protein [Pseudonocardia sp. HH130630-07]ANY08984.1 hypothetical protein AFB00_24995 [Pseudonocardia sp. HH130630-07]
MADITPGGDGAELGSAAAGGSAAVPATPLRVLLDGEPFAGAARRIAGELAGGTVASRLADGDPSVWGPAATGRTGWVDLARTSRPVLGQIAALRERFAVAGAHRVLLVGTPDAVAAARLCAELGSGTPRLTALDSADPVQIAEALSGELTETVLVVADPAGDDPVVDAVRRAVTGVLADEIGPDELAARTVHLTEPGSPLDRPTPGGPLDVTVVTVDADVPGRFGALGPLGLVPAGLAGADVTDVLAGAVATADTLAADDPDNPALLLAGALAAARGSVLVLRDEERAPARTAWLAPLLTAAGLVVLPAGVDTADGVPVDAVDVHAAGTGAVPVAGAGAVRADAGPGASVVLWQAAAALAARVLGTDPFAAVPARPDGGPDPEPLFVDDGVAVHAGDWLPRDVDTVAGALDALCATAGADGHLAVSAWLDPESDASVAVLRGPLATRSGLPVAFGWAPGCRSGDTGAPDRAVHCHLTGGGLDGAGDPGDDTGDPFGVDTAPEPSGLTSLHTAQARAVASDQRRRGRPVLRLHLTDRLTGLVTLARAVQD